MAGTGTGAGERTASSVHGGERRRGARYLAAGAAVVVALPLAATSASAVGSVEPHVTVPAVALGTNGAAVPALDWQPCPPDPYEDPAAPAFTLDCATAAVPLDYADPDGASIDLALARRPADDPAEKIGTLFVNPGGPGGSGVDFVSAAEYAYSPQVLARFDVVGFDPRGVARSAPLTCFPSLAAAEDFATSLPSFPVGVRQERAVVEAYRDYTRDCAVDPDAVLNHMSTGDVARDLDLLRQAVGDAQLTYAGYSYGTQVGSTYANMFPDQVRALVLDGVVDPVAWTTGDSRRQALTEPSSTRLRSDEGASATLGDFFDQCTEAGPDACALATGDPAATYARVLDRLREAPVEIPLDEDLTITLTYADAVSVTLQSLYDPFSWPFLALAVAALDDYQSASATAASATAATTRAPAARVAGAEQARRSRAGSAWSALRRELGQEVDGDDLADEPAPQVTEGFDGVICSDGDNPVRARAWSRAAEAADERAPYFGRPWTWASIACATWPGEDPGRYQGPWTATTANPVLVVGNRYDPATRYQGAVRVAGLLPGARLLTLDGAGHTALGLSTCVADDVTAYLVDGALPAPGTVCEPDVEPFDVGDEPFAPGATAAQARAARQQVLDDLAVVPLG